MTRNDYRQPPEEVDMAAEEFAIRRDTTIALVVTAAGYTGAWLLAPSVTGMPTALPERLAFAALCWAVLGFILLVALMMVSTARRFSPEDTGGQTPPAPAVRRSSSTSSGPRVTIRCRAIWSMSMNGPWCWIAPATRRVFGAVVE